MAAPRTDYVAEQLPSADLNNICKFINASYFAGNLRDHFGLEASIPNGWLLSDGGTIGDASSSSTKRANADMSTLFALLWAVGNQDGSLSIYTSAGAGSTYGANAAADFAAHKRIALPDLRGRVTAGRDNMASSDAGRIVTNDTQGNKIGGVAGEENHTLSVTEIPAHTHNLTGRPDTTSTRSTTQFSQAFTGSGGTQTPAPTDSGTGGGGAHNNLQPSLFLNKIMCTGVVW